MKTAQMDANGKTCNTRAFRFSSMLRGKYIFCTNIHAHTDTHTYIYMYMYMYIYIFNDVYERIMKRV